MFTLDAQVLVPGHRQKIVLRSDSIQVQFSARVQGRDLIPGHGQGDRILEKVLGKKRCVHITASENRTRAPSPCSAPSLNIALILGYFIEILRNPKNFNGK